MNPRHLPNAITGLRLAVAPLLPWLMLERLWQPVLALALVAAASDLVDGWLARRYRWQTPLGGLLDPLADKAFVAMAFLGLWLAYVLPGWIFALVLGRDLLIVAGAGVWRKLSGSLEAAPSWLGKATTALQLSLLLLVLVQQAQAPLAQETYLRVVLQLLAGVALLTLISGFDYVIRYGAKAWLFMRNRKR